MRPDEHKKRKNTQYKKKHGIKGDGKAEGNSKDEDKSSKNVKQTNKKPENEGQMSATEAKAIKSSFDAFNPAEEEERSFSRRKLVSNWSRYDDITSDDDDDIPIQRGEDFTKLLTEAGGCAAQFRFKDEEEWSGATEGSGAGTLALDLEGIAQSLACLPLYQRLGIDQQLFMPEQLEEMQAAADESLQKYGGSQVSATRIEKTSDIPSQRDTLNKAVNSEHVKASVPLTKQEVTDNHISSKSVSAKDKVNECNKAITTQKQKTPEKSEEITSLEDDLDMLLSLEEPGTESAKSASSAVKTDSSVINNSERSGGKEDDVKKADTSVKGPAKEENLEDWLDSMLDD